MEKLFVGTKVYMLAPNSVSQMMGFVVVDDDKIIVIDGGTIFDADHLEKLLLELGGKVDLWIITHAHHDHLGALALIMERGTIAIEKLMFNIPTKDELDKICRIDVEHTVYDTFFRYLPNYAGKVVHPELTTYTCGNIKIEFFKVYGEIFTDNFNDTSLIFKLYTRGLPILFLGDLGPKGEQYLRENYADMSIFRCPVVQASHHGQNGVTEAMYDDIKPKVVLWPTTCWLWTNLNGKGGFGTLDTRRWLDKYPHTDIKAFGFDKVIE